MCAYFPETDLSISASQTRSSMNWLKIYEHKGIRLVRGSLLKFSTSAASGNEVIMLVCDSPSGSSQLGLIPVTGDNAGHNYFTLFPEDVVERRAITVGVIYDNWPTYIGAGWDADSAWISREGFSSEDLVSIRNESVALIPQQDRLKKWVRLSENRDISLSRGSLIRFSASYPFEDEVVMMFCDSPRRERAIGLITISGLKAGFNCYLLFPEEATNPDFSINAGLIYDNWATWVWPEWSPDTAWILQEGLRLEDL